MMSSLLLSYIKKSTKSISSSHSNSEIVQTDQVHHYIYHADSLSHLCFYDFVRNVRIETKARGKRTKNTHELGILKCHILKDEHPLSKTHILIEHINNSCGDSTNEYIPHIVGCSCRKAVVCTGKV